MRSSARLMSASSALKAATPPAGSSAQTPRRTRSGRMASMSLSVRPPSAAPTVRSTRPPISQTLMSDLARQSRGDVGIVRRDREVEPVGQEPGRRQIGRAGVNEDELARPHEFNYRLAERRLPLGRFAGAFVRRPRGGRQRQRAAMHPPAKPTRGQIAQIAPDGVVGSAEGLRQVSPPARGRPGGAVREFAAGVRRRGSASRSDHGKFRIIMQEHA